MLTASDVQKRLEIDTDTLGYLYAKRILPDGIKIGGVIYFREQDIKKFERYLKRRAACRLKGIDPDSFRGPSVPVYSTGGKPRFDPRLVVANEQERARQLKSKTLAAGTTPIPQQQQIKLPEVDSTTKVEGK